MNNSRKKMKIRLDSPNAKKNISILTRSHSSTSSVCLKTVSFLKHNFYAAAVFLALLIDFP